MSAWKFFSFLLVLSFCFSNSILCAEDQAEARKVSPPAPYVIGPSDLLNIYVWKEAELTQDVTVMSDGRITFPLIGEVMAQGRTINELREVLSEKLGNYVDVPEVTVILRQSLSRRIYTIGKLNRPGQYGLEPNMTVLQALSAAGGFAEWADTKNILIVRTKDGKQVQLPFNYKEFISGKNLEQNVILQPNDTIVVP